MGITLPGRFFLEGYIKKGIISGTLEDEIKYGRDKVQELLVRYQKSSGSFTITRHGPVFPNKNPTEGTLQETMARLYRIELQGNALATTETVREFLANSLSDLETILGDEDGGPVKIRHFYLKEKR